MQFRVANEEIRKRDIPESHKNNFNVIRLIAAFLVIYGHMSAIVGLPIYQIWGRNTSSYGLFMLFAIGGCLIAESWNRDSNTFRYFVRRVFRIMPGYIVMLLFSVLVVGTLVTSVSIQHYFEWGAWDYFWHNVRFHMIYNLPGVFLDNPYPVAVNGSLWSLPVEMTCYVIAYIILRTRRNDKRTGIVLFAICSCVFGYLYSQLNVWEDVVVYNTSLRSCADIIPFFAVGMAFSIPEVKKTLNIQVAMVLLLALALVEVPDSIAALLLYIVVPYIVFSFAYAAEPVFCRLGRKYEISYGLYLYAFPVQQLLVYYTYRAGYPLPFVAYMALTLLFTSVLALLSYRFVEKPAMSLAKKLLKWSANRQSEKKGK